ncbi:MAG: hypothetical protein WD250_04170 [Egibacteraceae bacterium]
MLRGLLRRIAAPAHRAADAIPGVRRREDVLSFGQTSKGVTQVRGNGTLVLTDDRLVFLMWMPRRELVIPLAAVEAVDTTRSHLGKTMGRDLLRVCWRDPRGGEDAIAWLLDDLGGWHTALGGGPSG